MTVTLENMMGDLQRLATLKIVIRAIDDAGTTFDRLARLASRLASAPVGVMTLQDGGVVYVKGSHGLPVGWKDTPEYPILRDLCRQAIDTKSLVAVSDIYTNQTYTKPDTNSSIAFVALPLHTSDNLSLGCVCAVDFKKRRWRKEEIDSLADLAEDAVSELELRSARYLYHQKELDLQQQSEHHMALLARQNATERQLLQLGFDQTAKERAVTARKQIENILEGITDGFFALDSSMHFTYVNKRAEKMLKCSRGALIDTRIVDHPAQTELVERLRGAIEHKTADTFEYQESLQGNCFEVVAYPSSDGVSVYFHDITARKAAQEELERRSNELQALSRRLVEVQEAERGQVARELHDEVGQILTGLKLTLSASRRLKDEARDAQLDDALKLVNELIGHVRDLSLDLRPAMLDDLGLLPALLWHFERFTSQTSVKVQFSQSDLHGRFDSAVETAAYRIVQEALTNVARYSRAGEATVSVHNMGDMLHIEVQDEGVGFDPDKAMKAGVSNGLTGMRERATLLRGFFSVISEPGSGTMVVARIPIPADESDEMEVCSE